MPQVPIYNGPQVERQAFNPQMQATPDVSSGLQAVAQGVSQLGEGIDRYQQRKAVDEAFQLETKVKSDWLETDAALRQKYKGNNVEGYQQEVEKWWQEAPTKYGANASPLGQRLASKSIGQYALSAKASSLNYLTAEQERALQQNYAATREVTIQSGLRDVTPANAELVAETTLQSLNKNTAALAATQGWSTEQYQAEQLRNSTALHRATIAALVDVDAAAAKKYYDKYRPQIDGAFYGTLDAGIANAASTQEAARLADSMIKLPYDEQLKKVSEIEDPVLRDKTRTAVKQNQGDMLAAQQAREKQFSDAAWQMVGQGKRVPEAVLSNMDGRERVQLQDYLRQRAEHYAAVGNKPAQTDPKVHAELWEKMTRDPNGFKEIRLQSYAFKLSQADLEQLYKAQQGLLNPKTERDVISYNNKVMSRLRMMNAATGKGTEVLRGQFEAAATREIEQFQARTGKMPTPKEEDEILDRLMLPGKSGWFSDSASTYAESVATGKTFVPKIPDADRKAIYDEFRRKGISPSDEQIIATYKMIKGL